MSTARPILFSAPMVLALLDGRKTQTRRICKNKIYSNGFGTLARSFEIACHNYLPPSTMLMDVKRGHLRYTTSNAEGWESECPYGTPGDLLWVRETFRPVHSGDPSRGARYRADPGEQWHPWKPGIHMPRWASRLTLRITQVRVQKLQEIGYEDAIAEGCLDASRGLGDLYVAQQSREETLEQCARRLRWPQRDYETLWTSINGPKSWAANPWVWALTFEVLKQNVDAVRSAGAAA